MDEHLACFVDLTEETGLVTTGVGGGEASPGCGGREELVE
jgi:hypothetical protein